MSEQENLIKEVFESKTPSIEDLQNEIANLKKELSSFRKPESKTSNVDFKKALDEYFAEKNRQVADAKTIVENAQTNSEDDFDVVNVSFASRTEQLKRLSDEFVGTVDRIKAMLERNDYNTYMFDSKNNNKKLEQKRKFWNAAYALGGRRLSELYIRSMMKHFG